MFVNVAGGVRVDEPGADLPIALAIASAAKGQPVHEGLATFGEIGLTGRLRPAQADGASRMRRARVEGPLVPERHRARDASLAHRRDVAGSDESRA